MRLEKLIPKVSRLSASCKQEVLDFITFPEPRYSDAERGDQVDGSEQQFRTLSVEQAMRGLEDEPDLYSEEDLK